MNSFSCPLPVTSRHERVLLGHGSGGRLSAQLMRDVFLPAFSNPALDRLDDQAELAVSGARLAFTTDSFVVKPLFFPGGDIGSLAVHGTVNDLAMGGARPLYLSAGFILEEGFPMPELARIVNSMSEAARRAGVAIVTGDTKVVERGSGDGVFINTSGIGLLRHGVSLSSVNARPGDRIILSGPVAEHGVAILAARGNLELGCPVESDSAPLHSLVEAMLATGAAIRCMRDPTRGGLASALNEIAAQSRTGMRVDENAIAVREPVRAVCELLGFDPLYVANEGKLVAVVAPEGADSVVAAMRAHPLGRDAAIIGEVTGHDPGLVLMTTLFGTTRIVDLLPGDQLPRIC